MNINCKEVAERHLLNQNPLYTLSFPLSLLIAIIIFGMAKAYNWSSNSYINQILIPILSFLIVMVILDVISRCMISNDERNKIISECKSWGKNSPPPSNYPIENFSTMMNSEDILNEKVDNKLEVKKENYNVTFPISEIPNIFPSPLESKPTGDKCLQNSNCCSLCSGSDSNPCNIIAPIPGPQWIPQSAKAVQERLVKNDYTKAVCNFKNK